MGDSGPNKLKLRDVAAGVVYLPGGFIDEKGVLHDRAELREMTGEEEDILALPKVSGAEKISRIIGNCFVKLGTLTEKGELLKAARKLTIGDRVVLMLALRAVSLGSTYSFTIPCASCEAQIGRGVNLAELEVKVMTSKTKRETDTTLPSGKKATLRVMTGEDEERIGKVNRKGVDALSLAILARTKTLDGKEAPGLSDVKKLGIKDRNAIRDWYKDSEGGVDTDLQMICDQCGHEFEAVLDIGQPSFFFPKASEETTKSL